MKLENRNLTETEKSRVVWGITYVVAVIVFSYRAMHTWDIFHAHPFVWWHSIFGCMNLLFCLFPLLFGITIRRQLKRDLDRDLVSARTCQVYGYLVAFLLYFSYMAMELYEQPR